jgi:DNA-binding transcriptional MerR regulator
MLKAPGDLLKIGAVSARSNISVKTIRFYCDEGLLLPVSRTNSRYRLFDESVFADLGLILRLRAMDLPLDLVKQVIHAQRSGICTCSDLKATMREKLSEIHERVDELKVLETEIKTMLKSWEPCGGAL